MATQGGVVENKSIGISISTDGTFENTELVNDKIQLKKLPKSEFYYEEGSWTSKIIDIGDNFKEYGKLHVDNINTDGSSITVLTRTSPDGVNFESLTTITEDGSLLSQKNRYIQVVINLSSGNKVTEYYMPLEDLAVNEYTEATQTSLQLKREYQREMENDNTWTDTGSLHKKKISRGEWVRIDRLDVRG